jgi:rubrerythrin
MGLIERMFGWRGPNDEEEKPFRCIACGTEHDRQYAECPECGRSFVAPKDD